MPRKQGLSLNHHRSQMKRKVQLVSRSGSSIKHCHSALPLRCEITAEREESLSKRVLFFFFMSRFGCQLHTLRCACTQAPFQSVHCENRQVPASLNSSHRQHSCDCQFHAWLVVITLQETKNGEGGMHFRIKIESETSLKSQVCAGLNEKGEKFFACLYWIHPFILVCRTSLSGIDVASTVLNYISNYKISNYIILISSRL